jgi:hypothetical protein
LILTSTSYVVLLMNDEPVILLVYVDDLFLTREENIITKCKKKLIA